VEEFLIRQWVEAAAGDPDARAQWQLDEGGGWSWERGGAVVRGGHPWSALGWRRCEGAALAALGNFTVEVTVTGAAAAAGLSFGPYKDFLTALRPSMGPSRLQLEVDAAADRWSFRVDGRLVGRDWWDSAVRGVGDLLDGRLTLKANHAEEVRFEDLAIHRFESSCRLSVIMICHRFLQRMRVTLRNWCHQELPSGAYEILVVNPQSPDGTHEHLAAVARSYPHIRVRELEVEPALAINKGVMINRAVEASRGEWIWLTDADCLFPTTGAATVLSQVEGRERRLLYGRRRYLTAAQTDGLLASRVDGLDGFQALWDSATTRSDDAEPWGYTQIVHRSTWDQVRYREDHNHFAWSDIRFLEACQRRRITPEQVDGLVCLHLDHPFAWYGTDLFL
jgi:Glycosyl transferase family 2